MIKITAYQVPEKSQRINTMNLPNQDLQNVTIEYIYIYNYIYIYTVCIDMMGVSENGVLSPI